MSEGEEREEGKRKKRNGSGVFLNRGLGVY